MNLKESDGLMRTVKVFYNAGFDKVKTLEALENEINDWAWQYAVKIINTSISCIDSMSFCAIVTYEGEVSDE